MFAVGRSGAGRERARAHVEGASERKAREKLSQSGNVAAEAAPVGVPAMLDGPPRNAGLAAAELHCAHARVGAGDGEQRSTCAEN